MAPRPGDLRERIEVQRRQDVKGATYGDLKERWLTVTRLSAKVSPLSGRESYQEDRRLALRYVRFETRYVADVNAKMRILWDGRLFDILSVLPDRKRRWLTMDTEEVDA